ncbi:hypothetical protein JR316_0004083 [Psilocybe cubensis]|uniref:Uncharacterized protein n=2 Tax=Psilocybe cubensis TaxID=181762 RepID=A0A8H7Y6H0_PSICU|nr:hypothetical protein JR316_0004083 [Psilocybe cubensis]KAH9484601.1 hypothetical protein JR316_0004083 [Psilocybe cubensis]
MSTTSAPPPYYKTIYDETFQYVRYEDPSISSMGNRPNLAGQLEYHAPTTNGSFSICLAEGMGVFISKTCTRYNPCWRARRDIVWRPQLEIHWNNTISYYSQERVNIRERMFSRTNHHHQHGQRASSLAPLLGTRRQRSPDSTPGPTESESDGRKLLQTKRSPHTKHLIKKGRTHPRKSVDASPDPSPQHSVNTPIPLADPHSVPNTNAAPPSTLPPPAVSSDIVAG